MDEPEFAGPVAYHTSRKGYLLIFSNTDFPALQSQQVNPGHGDQGKQKVSALVSSMVDGDRFRDAVQQDQFVSYQHHTDLTVTEMRDIIKALSEDESLREVDFLVMLFLTYGDHGLVYAKDNKIALQDLLKPIKADKCLHLAGKPKLIILQTTEVPTGKLEADGSDPERVVTIPSDADFLYLWSRLPADQFVTKPGEEGSLFISTLLSELTEGRTQDLDILKIMTRTIAEVERKLETTEEGRKQLLKKESELPFLVNQLTGILCLKQYF